MKRILFFALVFLAACASKRPISSQTVDCEAPVALAQGSFAGRAAGEGACAWKGISFGDSGPAYRFRRPGPAPVVPGVQQADRFGPACLSPVLEFYAPGGAAENCLNLSVWRPQDAPGAKHPVMVFFYGGAFVLGAGSWDVYDGAALARRGVVVVTTNYRLGPLGFYASPAQRAGEPDGAAGNWGMWDQVATLRWVRDNIAAFGGDPESVTVFGESAGAFSVCTLVGSPAAAGLFHKAIMESGGCVAHSLDEQFAAAKALVARTPCAGAADEMACLRGLDADELNVWQDMWKGSQPTVDGVFLKEQPLEAMRGGRAAPVPLLIGSNRDELRPVTVLAPLALELSHGRGTAWARLAAARPADVGALRAAYPDRPGAGMRELWVEAMGDVLFGCSVNWAAEAQAAVAPVFAYEFDIGTRDSWMEKQFGAYHANEIPYVFGFLGWPRVMNGGDKYAEHVAYSRRIQKYWTQFARTGDPNTPAELAWPRFAPDGTVVRLTPTANRPLPHHRAKACAYWAAQNYRTFPELTRTMARFSADAGVELYGMLGPE
jgi:para-nitrobenzyl esterase